MSDLLTLLETLGRSPTLRLEDVAHQLDTATRRQVAALAADASTLSCVLFTPEEAAIEANTYSCVVATPEPEVRAAEPYFCGIYTPEELA